MSVMRAQSEVAFWYGVMGMPLEHEVARAQEPL
jgi:hypothetical protein